MAYIDLVTGFLGSGKTTFIKKYASYLIEQGQKVGIIENDFGAINVDMLLLQDLAGDHCELEMVFGGNDRETYQRRLKTKLISMGMRGFQRIIIEPSGVFDVEEFFDVLQEEPLERWYEIGNVISIVDAGLDFETLSKEAKYLMTTQIANAGAVYLSRAKNLSENGQKQVMDNLNAIMGELYGSIIPIRVLTMEEVVGGWNPETTAFQSKILHCGYRRETIPKLWFEQKEAFQSLYFLNLDLNTKKVEKYLEELFGNETFGKIHRIKGVFQEKGLQNQTQDEAQWISVNATRRERRMEKVNAGQEVLIVIGEALNKEQIEAYLEEKNGNI